VLLGRRRRGRGICGKLDAADKFGGCAKKKSRRWRQAPLVDVGVRPFERRGRQLGGIVVVVEGGRHLSFVTPRGPTRNASHNNSKYSTL